MWPTPVNGGIVCAAAVAQARMRVACATAAIDPVVQVRGRAARIAGIAHDAQRIAGAHALIQVAQVDRAAVRQARLDACTG